MNSIIAEIESILKQAFAESGYDESYGKVTISNRPDLCEYQCNGALAAAKRYHKAPFMIADDVLAKIQDNAAFSKVEVVKPGFINMNLSGMYLAEYLIRMAEADRFGAADLGQGKTIVIDYGGPNVAKPLHIGHLRPAIIGESIKRIKRFCGYNMIGDVHLGDWGYQMGLILESLKEQFPNLFEAETLEELGIDVSLLEKVYPEASARAKKEPEFAEKAHMATFKLQKKEEPYYSVWKKIIEISVRDLTGNYKKLDVSFELWNGESDAQDYIPPMVEDLKAKGLAYLSDGALVVDVKEETDKKEIPPCLIVKSDGAYLYATTDLATLVQREQDYHPEQVIYVVDKRQEMHFTQVFRTAKKAGIVPDSTQLTFVGFGTMNGKDGKPFKTRDGGVMRLEKLIGDTTNSIYERLTGVEFPEEEKRDIASKVALAAIKYGDLSNQASKDYIFDIDRFCEFEGNTGPYILYTMVRIKSILRKCGLADRVEEHGFKMNAAASDSEKALQLELTAFHDMMVQACQENAPHKVCQYLYEVSNAFNSFYHHNNILKEEDEQKKQGYLALIILTYRILKQGIELLGFDCPERM